jgi:hypothetical protein
VLDTTIYAQRRKILQYSRKKLITSTYSPNPQSKSTSAQEQEPNLQLLKKARKLEKRRLRHQENNSSSSSSSSNVKTKLSSPLAIRTPPPNTKNKVSETLEETLEDLNTAAELQIRAELQRASQDPTTASQEAEDHEDAVPAEAETVALKARVGPSKRHRRFRERRKAWRMKVRERNAALQVEAAAGVALPV